MKMRIESHCKIPKRFVTLLFATLIVLAVLVSVNTVHAAASITTDKEDYSPGDTVIVSGSGFAPNSPITITVLRPDSTTDAVTGVTSDGSGAFTASYQLDGITGTYTVTARDGTNTATTTFTDAELVSVEVVAGTDNVPIIVEQGQTVSFTIKLSATGKLDTSYTSSNPATAKIPTAYSVGSGGSISAATLSSAYAFWHNAVTDPSAEYRDARWTGYPTPYGVSASASATSDAPRGDYVITIVPTLANPGGAPRLVNDISDTLTIRVVPPPDTTPPVVTITAPTEGGYYKSPNVPAGAYSVVELNPYTVVESGYSTSEGVQTYTVKATDAAGNVGSASVTYTVDNTPPVVTITAPVIGAYYKTADVPVGAFIVVEANPYTTSESGWANSPEGSYTYTVTATDAAGNVGKASVTYTVDNTQPVVTITAPANGAYYKTANVPVGVFTVVESNPYTAVESGYSTAEGVQTYTVTATDGAGNIGSASVTYTADNTAPVVTITAPAGGAYYKSSAVPGAAYSVVELNPYTVVESGYSTSEGVQTCTVTATDGAGNVGSDSVTYTVDNTPPVVTISAPAAGWYRTATLPALAYTATDNLDPNPSVVVSGWSTLERVHTVTVKATDAAGNVGSASVAYTVDNTLPVVVISAPAEGGYYQTATLPPLDYTVTDNLDPNPIVEASGWSTDEGLHTVTVTATDAAGNVGSGSVTYTVDNTPPTTDKGLSGTAGTNGWYTSNVDVTLTASDPGPGSGVKKIHYILNGVETVVSGHTATFSITTEGSNTLDHWAVDNAGNTEAKDSQTINIDKTPPSISGSRSPAANSYGWNNGDVTVSFTCTDAVSGVDSCSGPTTLSGEGAGQSVTGTATDMAGNSASATVGGINIDKTAPTITASISPAAPASTGWYNLATGVPTVSFSCSDDGSGLAGSCPAPVTLSEGADQSVSRTVYDAAGNSATAGISHINVDLTAPTVTITVPANGGFYVLGASVASSFSCADQTSGVASCTGPATVDTNSVGSKSFAVTATDNAGNPATLTNTYNVQYAPVGTMCLGSPSHQILQPINVDGSSVWKKGSTVPAKFRVCDAKGNSIGTPGVVVSFKLVNKDGGTVGPVDEDPVSTTPDIAFRWDPTSQQWIFNINTKNLTAGYTYTYQINLNDGTTIIFKFGLK